MKKLLYILPLLLGCVSTMPNHYTAHPVVVKDQVPTLPVAIDLGFSTQERALLHTALEEWNKALNGQMKLVVYTDRFDMGDSDMSYVLNSNGFLLLKVSRFGSVMYSMEDNTIAISDHIGGHIIYFLKEKVGLSMMRKVALHELGHLLGASHTATGLMQHHYNAEAYDCIDYATADQVAQYRGLDVSKMNWCVKQGETQ